jgi:hypothetical protein
MANIDELIRLFQQKKKGPAPAAMRFTPLSVNIANSPDVSGGQPAMEEEDNGEQPWNGAGNIDGATWNGADNAVDNQPVALPHSLETPTMSNEMPRDWTQPPPATEKPVLRMGGGPRRGAGMPDVMLGDERMQAWEASRPERWGQMGIKPIGMQPDTLGASAGGTELVKGNAGKLLGA